MAHTLEFWKRDDTIMVEYNLKVMGMEEFASQPDARRILDLIYDKIVTMYPKEVDLKQDKGTLVAQFVKQHFLGKDKSLDVVLLGDGSVVKFSFDKE